MSRITATVRDYFRFMIELERGRPEWEARQRCACRQWNYANKGPR